MMASAIKIEHVSKQYRIGTINHGMLYKDIQSGLARLFGKPDPHTKIGKEHFLDSPDRFWALRDICFDIEQGDRIGIIGRNGAGKSTLLKLISRITAPTEGRLFIRGKVSSLLEVGTGFHPELTGRDNIYLSGAIQGMKAKDIERKIDEIIEFSEIGKFIDTPVKRYSSGMFVRLGFSVAAFLESDIIIADEILAVGDAAFQQKCLEKLKSVNADQGRTIIFVSHNMGTISALCEKGVLLRNGSLEAIGAIASVIAEYASSGGENRYANEGIIAQAGIRRAWIEDGEGNSIQEIQNGEQYAICIEVESAFQDDLEIKVLANDELMRPIWAFTNSMYGIKPLSFIGKKVIRLFIENQSISTGAISFEIVLRSFATRDELDSANTLRMPVVFSGYYAAVTKYHEWPFLCRITLQ